MEVAYQIKLECYRLAGGDMAEAKKAYAWVTGQEPRPPIDERYQQAVAGELKRED